MNPPNENEGLTPVKPIPSMLRHGSHDMNRSESILIRLFIGIACPYLAFVAFWWSTAAFHFYVSPLPDSVIATMALTGLGLGCLLDAIFLRRWVEKFYTTSLRWMFVFYCGCFVVGFASFMGFPPGTFALGVLAGAYIGRRARHHRVHRSHLAVALRRTAFLTSLMTTAAALPIAILGLKEKVVCKWFEAVSGLDHSRLYGTAGFILVGLFSLLLFATQYGGTRIAGHLASKIGTGHTNNVP